MNEREIKEFIRLVGSLSLNHSGKQRLVDYLNQHESIRKEIPVRYFAVASAVAFLAVGTYLLKRGSKQDINIM